MQTYLVLLLTTTIKAVLAAPTVRNGGTAGYLITLERRNEPPPSPPEKELQNLAELQPDGGYIQLQEAADACLELESLEPGVSQARATVPLRWQRIVRNVSGHESPADEAVFSLGSM